MARDVREKNPTAPIILLNRHSSEERAIAALRAGVTDYFKTPYSDADVADRILRNLSRVNPPNQSVDHRNPDRQYAEFIGESARMLEIKARLEQISRTDCSVLITGETGTGKERVADLIHQRGARRAMPLVRINCAALPDSLLESALFGYEHGALRGTNTSFEGKLKLAEGGTVFLDEIADLSPYGQATVLRVLEAKEAYRLGGKRNIHFDFRLIAATNRDLERLVAENRFRKDLFFRINVARIHLPMLNERREDIPLLIDHYLQKYNARFGRQIEGLAPEAWSSMLLYDWPGNVRELHNTLEAILIGRNQGQITAEDLPQHVRSRRLANEQSASNERDLLLSVLSECRWNKREAAKRLGCSRMTLYRKMAGYRIDERHTDLTLEAQCRRHSGAGRLSGRSN
jgi:DNA-binding NtrC family response regulator